MALKYFTDQARVTDDIVFRVSTPDQTGCNIADPYELNNIKIYFVERSFLDNNFGEYNKVQYDTDLLSKTSIAEKKACEFPTDENILVAQNLRNQLELSSLVSTYYFNDALLVNSVGTSQNPAWLSSDTANAQVVKVTEDEDGNPLYGVFEYTWSPEGSIRAGDFFVCWTWTPQPAGDSLSAHEPFSLVGDPNAVAVIPTHLTPDNKYTTLLERYLPEMFKEYISDNDITPEILDSLNKSIAKGFTFIENYAAQLIDLLDANVLHESMLVYLANLFNLKLRTSEPALWRRQIKSAILLYKRKGTLGGLKEALLQADMELNKITKLYQVISPYNWTESFIVKDSPTFNLKYIALEPSDSNFFVYLRRSDSNEYIQISMDNIQFETTDCNFNSVITWIGDKKSSGALDLFAGDVLRITYNYNVMPSGQQSIEDYIQALPLADLRDELDQEYPPKNWNVKFIEEDDPLLPVLCPVIHPFKEPVIFGHIRTEFPYSENVYNADEYNGSIRETTNPCFIDKDWIDSCSCCLSSSYNIDVNIKDLSNERLMELRDILVEFTPFHAVPYRIYFSGTLLDFVQPPIESYQKLIFINMSDYLIASTNNLFTRFMGDGITNFAITRGDLGDAVTVIAGQTGTAYNINVNLIVPLYNLSKIGINLNDHLFEILGPSINQGEYNIDGFNGQAAYVSGTFIEPINESAFTCSLYNITHSGTNVSITQEDLFTFYDDEADYTDLNITSLDDVDNGYATQAFTISIPAYSATPYQIQSFVNNQFTLLDPSITLPITQTNNITYTINDGLDTVYNSSTGTLKVKRRGLVNFNTAMTIEDLAVIGSYINYSSQKYIVSKLVSTSELYIDNYTGGDVAGVSADILKPIFQSQIGYFSYSGLRLITPVDYEVQFNISNGQNFSGVILENNNFKENFLVKIDGYYYKIIDIDSTTITLAGFPQNWTTLGSGGTLVNFDVIQIQKLPVTIDGLEFDELDRRNRELITASIESGGDIEIVALGKPDAFQDTLQQEEKIQFTIERRDGTKTTGELSNE